MQIAEQIMRNGTKAGTAFMDALTALVADNQLTRIIETGTYHGLGTTFAILRGIRKHSLDSVFVTIEKDINNYNTAKANLVGHKVEMLHGLSIPKRLLPKKENIDFKDYPDTAIVDHMPQVRAQRYYDETAGAEKDNLLKHALHIVNGHPDLVVLDSAGHIGTVEFKHLMTMVKGEFYLALDDTLHVKHIKTVPIVENDYKGELIWETSEKFGSRIYKIKVT